MIVVAQVYRWVDEYVAHMPGVRARVASELEGRAARVRAVISAHRRTGQLQANVRVGVTDTQVVMEDPAVYAINYGHAAPNGRWVPGIHAIEEGL